MGRRVIIPPKKQIAPDCQFERDLVITGDDRDDLLQAAQKQFRVNLTNGENGVRTI
jgi:hypothetical protein